MCWKKWSPLSNCRHTSGHAEWNSRRSRILAAANNRVAHAQVNKPHVSNGKYQTSKHDRYKNACCLETFSIFWVTKGNQRVNSLEENEGTDWRCRVGTALKQSGSWSIWKVCFKPKSPHRNSSLILWNWLFLKALTITKYFTDNTEFNKRRSQLVAALE